ncbi:MAG: hypothetical protein IJ767_04000 [Bacteroidaceae bacterium]|nr:hypothetical protein [Bacteroidaceae bacterium]
MESDQVTPTKPARPTLEASGSKNPLVRNYGDYMRMLCSELGRMKRLAEDTLSNRECMMQSNNRHTQDQYAWDFEQGQRQLHYNLDRCYRLLEQAEMQLRYKPFE